MKITNLTFSLPGTSFTVLWENVQLQDLAKRGGFTFSATLHQNGDIIFGYYSIPMSIDSIEDKKHPVKVGLSDAYISDKTVFYTRRKTIFEYHRVNFESTPIKTNTMIILRPEPTCNIMQTCSECTALKTFKVRVLEEIAVSQTLNVILVILSVRLVSYDEQVLHGHGSKASRLASSGM